MFKPIGEINKPKKSLNRKFLQWLAIIPAMFVPSIRRWLVASIKQDRAQYASYQRYLNRLK